MAEENRSAQETWGAETGFLPFAELDYTVSEQGVFVRWPAFNELLRRVYRLEQQFRRVSALEAINGDPSKWIKGENHDR